MVKQPLDIPNSGKCETFTDTSISMQNQYSFIHTVYAEKLCYFEFSMKANKIVMDPLDLYPQCSCGYAHTFSWIDLCAVISVEMTKSM